MSRWQLICVLEAVGILATWWWLGGEDASGAAEPSSQQVHTESGEATRLESNAHRSVVAPPSSEPVARTEGVLPHPWSSSTDRVTLLLEAVDDTGAPVPGFGLYWISASGERQWMASEPGKGRLVRTDLAPERIELDVNAQGFLPLREALTIHAAPIFQRHELRLTRARRVLIRVHMESGVMIKTWLQEQFRIHDRSMHFHAVALEDAPSSHRAAKEQLPYRSEWGAFVSATGIASTIPKNCVGALDLETDRPLVAAVWLDRILLGSVPIAPTASEITLRVNEAALVRQFARLRFRVIDAASGAPVEGAEARLGHAWGGSGPAVTTRADGYAEFVNLLPENLDLIVTLNGYDTISREVQLDPAATSELGDLRLYAAGVIRARLLNESGEPMPRYSIHLFPTTGWQRPEEPRRSSVGTNAEGRIEAKAGGGRYQAIVGGRDGRALQAVVWENGSDESGEREIRMIRGVGVRLDLLEAEKHHRLVWLLDANQHLLSSSRITGTQPWELTLAPGPYLLRVEDLDRNHLTTLDLHVPDGGGEIRVALP